MRYVVETGIAAPPERIWAVLVDVERWPEWTRSMRRVRRLDGGELAVGSLARVEQPGLPPTVWRVTTLEPSRGFAWSARSLGVASLADHRLTVLPDGTVRVALSIEQTGFLAPVVRALAGSTIRRYMRMEADGLKRRSEAAEP
jgi:uncharacterized protein YndB with AHSA1/START domain